MNLTMEEKYVHMTIFHNVTAICIAKPCLDKINMAK